VASLVPAGLFTKKREKAAHTVGAPEGDLPKEGSRFLVASLTSAKRPCAGCAWCRKEALWLP
jgi:hypothetical protein